MSNQHKLHKVRKQHTVMLPVKVRYAKPFFSSSEHIQVSELVNDVKI